MKILSSRSRIWVPRRHLPTFRPEPPTIGKPQRHHGLAPRTLDSLYLRAYGRAAVNSAQTQIQVRRNPNTMPLWFQFPRFPRPSGESSLNVCESDDTPNSSPVPQTIRHRPVDPTYYPTGSNNTRISSSECCYAPTSLEVQLIQNSHSTVGRSHPRYLLYSDRIGVCRNYAHGTLRPTLPLPAQS